MSRIEFPFEPSGVDYGLPIATYLVSRSIFVGTLVGLPFLGYSQWGDGGALLGMAGTSLLAIGGFLNMALSDGEGSRRRENLAFANQENREAMLLANGGPQAFSALSLKARTGAQLMTWMNTLSGGRLTNKVRQAEKLVIELGEDEETYWLTSHSNKGVSEPAVLSKERFEKMKKEIDKTDVPLQILRKEGDLVIERTTVRGKLDSKAIKAPALRVIKAGPEIQSHADLPHALTSTPEVLAEAWFDGKNTNEWSRTVHSRLEGSHALIRKYAQSDSIPQYPAELVSSSRTRSLWYHSHSSEIHPDGFDSLPKEIDASVRFAEKVTFTTLSDDENGAVVQVSVGGIQGESMPCRILTGEEANTWVAALGETDYHVEVDGTLSRRGQTLEDKPAF
jgi:hypothetical protein